MLLGTTGDCQCKGLMICCHMELPAFNEIPKMFDGEVDCQEFSIECTVLPLCGCELSEEICKGAPVGSYMLL